MNYSKGFVGNKLVSRVTSLFFPAVVELVLTKEKESNVYRMPLFPGICVEFHFMYTLLILGEFVSNFTKWCIFNIFHTSSIDSNTVYKEDHKCHKYFLRINRKLTTCSL